MTEDRNDLPAALARPEKADPSKRTSKGILCPKCSHVNKPGSTKCSRCESHLHIKCNDCGATNERSHSRCQECGRRLHKSTIEKMNAKMFKNGAKVTPWQVVLLVLVVTVLFLIVHLLNQLSLSPHR